jgi:hypothetical protein
MVTNVPIRAAAALLCATVMTSSVLGQNASIRLCEEKGTNGMVTLLLCPQGMELETMMAEGRAACGDRKPCGAWIWVDPENIPEVAPDSHDKLPKESVQSAVAIWVNEDQRLITLEKLEKN